MTDALRTTPGGIDRRSRQRSEPRHRAAAVPLLGSLLALAVLLGAGAATAQDPDLPGVVPNMELISAGALVIPMDNTNQAVLAPFNLKAYGLVNLLLQNEIPVQWAISATKIKDGVDFTVDAERILPTAVASTTKAFSAGPFIVTQDFAAQAQTLATSFGNSVAVFRTTADVTVDIRYDLRFKPYIGIGNVNTAIHSKIMTAAGIPGTETCGAHNATTCNWTMVDPLVVNNFACLTSHTDPHREDKDLISNPAIRAAISSYLQSGGNFIAQCAAVRFFEGETGEPGSPGVYITTTGVTDADNSTVHTFLTPTLAFSQIEGDVDTGQGGSWSDGVLPAGGAFRNNGHIQVLDASPANSFQAAAGKVRTGIGGNVFYLGGHDYDNAPGKPIAQINGVRMMLNTLFVPPTRPPSCGFSFLTQGRITILKDTDPDNPWYDFNFTLDGPSPHSTTLQDPGGNECPGDPLCTDLGEESPAWDHDDRVHLEDREPTTSLSTRYTVTETGIENGEVGGEELSLDDYTVTWECKNVPLPETNPVCDPDDASFDFDACPGLAATCALDGAWSGGYISGEGTTSLPFDLCEDGHVICRFTNEGGPEDVCLESDNAVGDLQALCDAPSGDQVSFTTAAVSLPSGDSPDSIFLASFIPIADQSRWPGTVDHFVQPLPLVENAQDELVPDKSVVCEDAEDTGCLAWDAGVEILDQAPDDASEVAIDRQIGMEPTDRRVTYTQAASGSAVPRSIRAFDYGDSDAIEDERDLWLGMGIAFTEGDADSEELARNGADGVSGSRGVIRDTLVERTVLVTDPDTGTTESRTFVAGDFFHGSPLVLGGPSNFFYLANDLENDGTACDDGNPGYRCFFEQQRRRRRVLLAPSNDGQLHAFDAGFFQGEVVSSHLVGEFDHGTGKELFAHIPRPMLAHTRAMLSEEHDFGIDGSLVADDVFIDPAHDGTPGPDQRQWRTVVIGSYREGASGLYALDLTQPDPVEPHNVLNFAGNPDVEYLPVADHSEVPECSALGSMVDCSQPYPSALWEFQDECTFVEASTGTSFVMPCDADTNGYPDLASSWSNVNTGRVLVLPDGETDPANAIVKFVAIFGGGLDADNPDVSGNFLYMVDIETGKAIYKRELEGAVPSEPAAVDTNQNGILDTLYIGTTSGKLYKADISAPGELDADGVVSDPDQWAPFPIFDTEGRPIFFPPTVLFDSNSGHYAVGFGTGDREDMWSFTDDCTPVVGSGGPSEGMPCDEDELAEAAAHAGRFYMILDTGFVEGVAPLALGPLTEEDFEQIAVDSDGTTGNFLLAPVGDNLPGWVLLLGNDERVVNKALAISGLLAFTTFDPSRPEVCTFCGEGRIYTLKATNANSIAGIEAPRYRSVEGFASAPVVTSEGFSTQGGQEGESVDPFEVAEIQSIRDSLMDLFPADCRFGNFSLNVSSSLSSREVVPLAQIPVCIARKNWTEHF